MAKRKLTPTETTDDAAKRMCISKTFAPVKVATAEAAAAVDANPPLLLLENELKKAVEKPRIGDSVIYWMRMVDLRSEFPWIFIISNNVLTWSPQVRDNRALSRASEYAKKEGVKSEHLWSNNYFSSFVILPCRNRSLICIYHFL